MYTPAFSLRNPDSVRIVPEIVPIGQVIDTVGSGLRRLLRRSSMQRFFRKRGFRAPQRVTRHDQRQNSPMNRSEVESNCVPGDEDYQRRMVAFAITLLPLRFDQYAGRAGHMA
jgi:hypothetical protein